MAEQLVLRKVEVEVDFVYFLINIGNKGATRIHRLLNMHYSAFSTYYGHAVFQFTIDQSKMQCVLRGVGVGV